MSAGTDNSSLASSLTDLMTSLAVIFVLLLVASLNNMGQKGVQTRDQMVLQLKQALREFAGEGVRVENDPKDPLGLLVLVPEGLRQFAFDKSDIPPQGVEFLRRFAPRLSETVCSARFGNEIRSIIGICLARWNLLFDCPCLLAADEYAGTCRRKPTPKRSPAWNTK